MNAVFGFVLFSMAIVVVVVVAVGIASLFRRGK